MSRPDGPPTVMAIGITLDLGAGLGSTTLLGVLLLTTTAGGIISAAIGAGALDRSTRAHSTLPLLSGSWAALVSVSALVSVEESAGSR